MFVCSVSAEQFKITGKVVDAEYKEPFIGALVEIKDADSRTSTDIDGNFSIDVEKGAVLRFSYVGYHSKEVEVLNDSSLFIELEEDENNINPDNIIIMLGTGPSQCPCPRHSRERGEYHKYLGPIESDSTKTNPKNQKSMINH